MVRVSGGPKVSLGERFDGLLSAAQRGDREAVGALYAAFQPALRAYLRARLPRDGDDVASEIWIAVGQRLHTFVGDEGMFRAWLFTLARRRVNDHHRRELRRAISEQGKPLHDRSENDPALEVIENLSEQSATRRLRELLTTDQFEVILLRIVAELEVAEVAAAMHRTDGWVRVTQHRALRRLERLLDGEDRG